MISDDEREFQRVVAEGLVPQVENSTICVSLCPTDDALDAKFCVELGVMVMLDKPIIAVLRPGAKLPKKLEMVADKIVHADITTDEGQRLLHQAIDDLAAEIDE